MAVVAVVACVWRLRCFVLCEKVEHGVIVDDVVFCDGSVVGMRSVLAAGDDRRRRGR